MLLISSYVRFIFAPYSAAQQPMQCLLQADVGSNRMAQGMLQPYFASHSLWRSPPRMDALMTKFSNSFMRTPWSISV